MTGPHQDIGPELRQLAQSILDKLEPAARGTGPAFDLGLARRGFNYAFTFTGFFKLDRDADCSFALASDDGARLFIDGKLVVDNDGDHPVQTRQGKASLAAGTHKVLVTYYQGRGLADLVVEIDAPGLGRRNLGDLLAPTEASAP